MKLNKSLKAFICAFALTLSMGLPVQSMASGIPVVDIASIAQTIKQLLEMQKQFSELQNQTGLAADQLDSLTGVRNMADLVNDPSSRYYIPADYQDILKLTAMIQGGDYDGLQDRLGDILDAVTLLDIDDTAYASGSIEAEDYVADQNQIALNSALAEAAYNEANDRTANIQVLLDKVNDATDPKDIADLQARIAAEQLMLTNEQNKLIALEQTQAAYWERQQQRKKEGRIMALGKGEYTNVDW